MQRIKNHLFHHWHFYAAAAIGALIFIFVPSLTGPERTLAAGNGFFLAYLATTAWTVFKVDADGLRRKAANEDEGIFLVIVITLAVIAISSLSIITVLREKQAPSILALTLAIAGAPMGWTTLHTIASFHYANLYYGRKGDAKNSQSIRGLEFSCTKEPGIWEFLYFAFTVGMTAQTSDTQVTDTKMRRATLGHSVVSYFYNAAIVAMAVNVVVDVAAK